MSMKAAHAVEIAVNAEGALLIGYDDPRLDATDALRFSPADRSLSAKIRNGLADTSYVSLGTVKPEFASRLETVQQVLFVRADDERVLHGGLIAVEQAK